MKIDKAAPVATAKSGAKAPRAKAPRAKAPAANAARNVTAASDAVVAKGTSDDVVAKDNGNGEAVADLPVVAREPEEDVVVSKEQSEEPAKQPAVPTLSARPAVDFAELSRLNRENLEAMMGAAAAVAKCCEALGSEWINYAKASMDEGVAASQALMGCTSMEQAIDVQSGYVKSAFDQYLSESTRLSEISLRMANEAFAPLNARLGVAVEALGRPVSR